MPNIIHRIRASKIFGYRVASLPFKKLLLVYCGAIAVLVVGQAAWHYRYSLFSRAFTKPSLLYLAPNATTEVQAGQTLPAQVSLLPEGNPVSGVDVILKYNPAYLQVKSLTKASNSPFTTFMSAIDQASQRISFSALAYDGNQPTLPVSGTTAVPLANITFLALTPGATSITFVYNPNSTTDSNVSIIENQTTIDALGQPTTQLPIKIVAPSPSPSPSPSPQPSPSSPTPLPSPSLSPSPSPLPSPLVPSPSPFYSPAPTYSPSPAPSIKPRPSRRPKPSKPRRKYTTFFSLSELDLNQDDKFGFADLKVMYSELSKSSLRDIWRAIIHLSP